MKPQAFLAALSALLLSCAAKPLRPESPAIPSLDGSYTIRKNVIYTPPGWPARLPADLYQPTGNGPFPAILVIHGGSWKEPERRDTMASLSEKLARSGYVVLNATYRLIPNRFPAPVLDLQQAILYLRVHAAELKVSPDRIGVFGYSAGGYFAELLAANPAPGTELRAVVAGAAPSDMRRFPKKSSLIAAFMGGYPHEIPAKFHAASPVNWVDASDPPVFLYHGGADYLVPASHSRNYARALAQAGVTHELHIIPALGHISTFMLDQHIVSQAIRFLDRHLKPPSTH